MAGIESVRSIGLPEIIPDMPKIKTGAVRTTLTQNRRVMDASSGFSSSSITIVRGSRAIPQIGHELGSSPTISGCIGHVYSIRVAEAATVDRSSAIPHFG